MEIVGIDVGFGFTKAYNGSNAIIFKSLIGEATEIQFYPSLGDESATSSLHITLDNKSYFIGSYAELQSKLPEFTLDQELLIENFVKILAITGVGLCSDSQEPLNVVTGLPVEYLRRDTRRLKEMIQGVHEITFHDYDGKDRTKQIIINKIFVIPQPIGSIFNLIFDHNGKIRDKGLATQKLGIVDIGFRTTDLSIFNHLQYIERGSATLNTGISRYYSALANMLRKESNINLELYRIFKFLESGMIKIRGKEYNISSLKNKIYSQAATTIASDLNRRWENDWDIDTIILSGGGSVELAEYLAPSIKGNVIPIQSDIDARLNNVQGYFKFGQHKWGSSKIETAKEHTPPPKAEPIKPKTKALETSDPFKQEPSEAALKAMAWLKRQT
jgi:plasmid segregation protein ParM